VRACVLDVGEFFISPKPLGCDDADAKSKQMQTLFPWQALGSNVFVHPASCGASLNGATSYQAPQPSPCICNLPTAIPPSFSLIQKLDPSCCKIASIQGKESRASSVPLVSPEDTDGSTFILTLRPPTTTRDPFALHPSEFCFFWVALVAWAAKVVSCRAQVISSLV
jgi:hypothetical protein